MPTTTTRLTPPNGRTYVSVDRLFVTADLQYYDANGDGKVTRSEFVDKPNPAFVLMDKSGTCKLDGSQIASARSKTEYDVSGDEAAEQRSA